MSKYNVILFSDLVRANIGSPVHIPAIGAFKLANTLRQNGYSCLVVNHISEFSIDELFKLLDIIISDETYLIGFSTTFYNDKLWGNLEIPLFPQGSEFDDQIFPYIKQLNDKVKVTVGGPVIKADNKNKYVDFLVLGYAEANIVNLVDHIKDGVVLTHSYKNINNNKIIINNKLADGYKFTNDKMTWLPEDVVNHTKLPIEIGRGCIFSCAFCSYPMNGKKKLDFVKEANILGDELLYNFNNYGITRYAIVDDTFNDSVDKLIQIREVILGLPFKPQFWCFARLDLICTHPETIHILYDIGIREIFFGIETLDRKSGLAIGKGYNREKQIAMISQIKKTYPNVYLHGSFIIGTPYESEESIRRTIAALTSDEIKLDSVSAQALTIYNTENPTIFTSKITKDYEKYGYRAIPNKSHQKLVLWENDELDFFKAHELATELTQNLKRKPQQAGGNGGSTEPTSPLRFLSEYKKRLFELITNNSLTDRILDR